MTKPFAGRMSSAAHARRHRVVTDAVHAGATAGRSDEIATCIACNQACLDHVFTHRTASCLLKPRACHETELVSCPPRAAFTSPSSAPGRPA